MIASSALYNPRLARSADVIAKKTLTGDTLVVLELERLRDLGEEEASAARLIDILKAPP